MVRKGIKHTYKYCIREEGSPEKCLTFESTLDEGIFLAEVIADLEWKKGNLQEDKFFTFDIYEANGELLGTYCIEPCNDGSPRIFVARELNGIKC
jgi:hypothetical protein